MKKVVDEVYDCQNIKELEKIYKDIKSKIIQQHGDLANYQAYLEDLNK